RQNQRVALASPDGPAGFLEARHQLAGERPPLEGNRTDRQHSAYLSGTNSERGVKQFYSGWAVAVAPQSAVLQRLPAVLRRLREARLPAAEEARMAGPEKRAKPLTFQELTELRRKTEAVSKFLQDQLAAHLETLRPVLPPERVFSKFLGTKGDHGLADRAFAQLQQNYRPFSGRPFDIPWEFHSQWLSLVRNPLALYPWEYAHEARTDRETKTITMASPVRWVVSFTS